MLLRTILIGAASAMLISAAQAQAPTVKIGLIQPLTGSVADDGTADVNGEKLAVEERNARGGVLGRQIELAIEDGQCKPAISVNAAEKLIQRDKVVALSGAFCSSATLAVMPVAENNKLPLITGVSSNPQLTEKGNHWFFRADENDALLAKAFAKILTQQMHLKKVAYVAVNDDFGRGAVDQFEKAMTELGATTAMKEYFEHGTTDFYTLLAKLKASGADGVFMATETQDGSIFVKQKAEFGLDLKVFGVGSWATDDFITLAGSASEGIYAAVPYAYTMTTPENKAFVETYKARYKGNPGEYSVAGYNVINILVDAIARAGSTEGEKIREALTKTDFVGPNGRFQFDEKGQAYGFSVVLVQITKGIPMVAASATIEP